MHGTGVGVADLNQVIQILVSGLTGERAREFHEVLQRGAVDPTFNECLATLFQVADPSVALAPLGQFVLPPTIGWNHLREISGLTLKNNIIRHASTLGPTCVFQIGQQACAVLSHADVRLVRTAGQIIAAITRRFGLDLWQKGATNPMVGTDSGPHDLMQHLSALAHHGNPSAFIALRYLFEDAHNALGSFTQDILFMVCHNALRCIEAIECLVAAYEVGADLIWPRDLCAMTEFQIGLWNSSEAAARTATTILSHNIPVVVRQGLLRLMRFMLAYREAFVLPPEIANTWVQCILHLFADTAYFPECCGFLTEICHVASEVEDLSDLQQDIFLVHITPQHIAQIVPVLLARMAYSDEEADEMLEQDSIRIRDLHVRPRACNSRGRKKAFSGDMVTDAVESHHQGDNEDVVAATVRTAALNCLQGFSLIHPNAVWFELRSVIQRRLEDADWKMRESSLLALGAVTHGCFRLLRKDFPSITTLVYERAASDAHVLVRCTACWLISSSLSLLMTIDGTHDKVNQGFQVILSCSLQESKRLQWASISSLQCMMVELMRYSRSHFDEIVPAFAETLPQLASQCQTNNLMLLLELFDGLIHAYPQLPYQAFLQVLFGRLEEARCALPEHPESVVVREMLYIFAPIANLLQNGLLLPAEAIEQLANMALQCIQHYIEHSDTVDADFFVYAIHLFSVLLHVNPEKYAGQHMANIHAHILNTTLLSNGHEVVVAALLYLEKMVMIYGGKSAIVANQSSQLNGMASDGSEGTLTSAPGVFMAAFETNIYPRLLQLASRQHDHMAECDAIWTLGQCLIHLQKVLNPSWCQQSILSLLNDLVRRISEGVEQVVRRISVLQDGAGESNLDQNSSKLDVSRILLNLSERVDLLSEDEIICTSVQTLMNVVRSSHDATVLDSFVKAAFPFFLSGTKEDSSINHHTLVICTIMMTVQRLPNDPYKAASMVGIVRLLSLILPHVPLASEALSCLVYLIAKHFFLAAQSFHETVPHPHNEVRESVRTMLVEILNAPNSSLGSVFRQFLDSTPPIAQKIQRQYLA